MCPGGLHLCCLFLFLLEILQSHPFLISRKFELLGWQLYVGLAMELNLFSPGLGHLFITSRNAHFFNKTDLEQHVKSF